MDFLIWNISRNVLQLSVHTRPYFLRQTFIQTIFSPFTGTGYIGVELAGIFHTLGSEVTIFSRTKQILRSFDPIIKDTLLKEMQNVGVNFVFDSDVRAISQNGDSKRVQYLSDGVEGEKEFDCVLWAVGREPNIDRLNLKAAGVTTKDNGYIVVDEYQNTSVAGVYALGDVCGEAELTPGKTIRT